MSNIEDHNMEEEGVHVFDENDLPEGSVVIEIPDQQLQETTSATSSSEALVQRFIEKTGPRSHKKFGVNRKSSDFEQQVINLLKEDDDEFSLYAKSIVPKLQKILESSRATFLRVQRDLNNVILDAELKLLSE